MGANSQIASEWTKWNLKVINIPTFSSTQFVRVLVINLDTQTERMAFQTSQLKSLGLEFERISACDKKHPAIFRQDGYWDTWQRALSGPERACLLSHQKAWQLIGEGKVPALVLEDDAVLCNNIVQIVQSLSFFEYAEHVCLETRNRKKLLSTKCWPLTSDTCLRRLFLDRTGAAAYVLWPQGAQRLLNETKEKCGLADAVICGSSDLVSFQIEPAAAIQMDQCDTYKVHMEMKTTSAITPSQRHLAPKNYTHRLRRLKAQIRMGWCQIRHIANAQRRFVNFDIHRFAKD
jgi:glycosyl transferase, family 25